MADFYLCLGFALLPGEVAGLLAEAGLFRLKALGGEEERSTSRPSCG